MNKELDDDLGIEDEEEDFDPEDFDPETDCDEDCLECEYIDECDEVI